MQDTRTTHDFILVGGFGGHNLGDEAILWALSRQLRDRDPNATIYVLVHGILGKDAASRYKEWHIEPVYGLSQMYCKLLQRARLIIGGGHLIDNVSRGMYTIVSSSFVFVNWLFRNKPMILFVGAEPVARFLPRSLVKHVYSLASVCTCRDPESASAMTQAGLRSDSVWVTKDVVFSLPRSLLPQSAPSALSRTPRIAVVIAYDRRRMRDDNEGSIRLVRYLLQSNFIVELIAHDIRPQYDAGALDMVRHHVGENKHLICHSAHSPMDAFTIYSQVHAVISGRMHPLIMAAMVGTLPIAYGGRSKVKSLVSMTGMPELSLEQPTSQLATIRALLSQRAEIVNRLSAALDTFRTDVEDSLTKVLTL